MWTIAEVKEKGKQAFRGNYWYCVLAAFLMGLFAGGSTVASRSNAQGMDPGSTFSNMTPDQQMAVAGIAFGTAAVVSIVGLLIKIFLANPIEIGGKTFFKSNVEATPAPLSLFSNGFRNYWHNFVTLFLRDLYIVLWSLLFVIPGIVKAYSYKMVPYILAENPDMPANEVITRSREMMNGNKWQAFLLDLSFIGWILLGIVTLGLGFVFWTAPYMNSTSAALYLKLKEARN